MATLTIPDTTYAKLRERAEGLHLSVPVMLAAMIEDSKVAPAAQKPLTVEEKLKILDRIVNRAEARKDRYQAALELNGDRDAMNPEMDATSAGLAESPLEGDAWTQAFEQMNQTILARADRYPPGFQVDTDRDSFYR